MVFVDKHPNLNSRDRPRARDISRSEVDSSSEDPLQLSSWSAECVGLGSKQWLQCFSSTHDQMETFRFEGSLQNGE